MGKGQLKAGWQVKELGEVCNLIGGGTPSKANEDFFKGDIFWATVRDMRNDVITHTEYKITEEAVENSSTNIIKAGNVVIATRVGLGKVCLINQDTAINQDLRGIVPIDSNLLLVQYLFWWLKSISHLIEKEGTGATVKGVKLPFVKSLQIPLPPLPEQKRIVAILDEAFAGINLAVVNAEKNLANARELFESYLNNVFTQKGEGWLNTELGDIINVLTDYHANGSYKILKQHVELKETEDFAWMVRSTDFEKNFKNDKRYISESAYSYLKKSQLFGGEIIMSKIGNAGKVYFMPDIGRPCSLAMNLFLIRLDDEKVSNEYVYRYLNSKSGKAQIAPMLNGAATQTITKDSVRSILVPLPAKNIQFKILRELELLEDETSLLESIYQQKLTALNELKQSILEKAFTGELTQREENV